MIRLPYDEVDWLWVANHYDCHLDGLVRYAGKTWRGLTDIGETYKDPTFVDLEALNWLQLAWWRMRQRGFETMVGRHWSYKGGKLGGAKRSVYTRSMGDWRARLWYAPGKFRRWLNKWMVGPPHGYIGRWRNDCPRCGGTTWLPYYHTDPVWCAQCLVPARPSFGVVARFKPELAAVNPK